MKTISIINLKGGVAKTLTADSMAHVLATLHNKRVLLVDNDKQGNTSKAFGVHSYDDKSISDVLTARRLDPREVIKKTRFENIDVMPANMTLIRANMEVLMDSTRPQQTRLRSALNTIAAENFYDFCIIDNAPDINISTINALVASDDVIIPIKIDKYAFDGLEELKEQIEDTRDDLNPRLRLAGCLITCFIRADAEKQGEAWLRSRPEYPVFDTRIRYSDKVTESTFSEIPIVEYSRRSGTAMDYDTIIRHLSPEFTEELKADRINLSTAYELAGLPVENQNAAFKEYHLTGAISIKAAREWKRPAPPAPPAENTATPTQAERPQKEREPVVERDKVPDTQAAPPYSAAVERDTADGTQDTKPTESTQQSAPRRPQATRSSECGICPYCGAKFDAAKVIEYSIRGAAEGKPHTCQHCGQRVKIFCSVSYFCSPAEE